jgi:hypothetical protein
VGFRLCSVLGLCQVDFRLMPNLPTYLTLALMLSLYFSLFLTISHPVHSVQLRPLSKPQNFPLMPGMAPPPADPERIPGTSPIDFEPPIQFDFSLSSLLSSPTPPPYESAFPVVNVRYTFPPTAVDSRRRLALASRQAQILDNAGILEARIMKDFATLMKHIGLQEEIARLFSRIPWSTRNQVQENLLRQLAEDIPETPKSSFLEEQPQINIAVEDNGADFSVADTMRPDQALNHMQEIQKSQSRNRGKILEILKLNVKIFNLVMDYLLAPMMKASKGGVSFIQQTPVASPPIAPAPANLTLAPPTPIPGWYSEKNKTRDQPVLPPAGPGMAVPMSLDFPFYMKLRARVMQAGAQGAQALATLIDLWNDQEGARDSIRRTMVGMDCKMLMMLPQTPDYVKNLAGSLLTLMSGIPSGSSVPDIKSGSYGHVNIVVPRPSRVYAADKEIALADES